MHDDDGTDADDGTIGLGERLHTVTDGVPFVPAAFAPCPYRTPGRAAPTTDERAALAEERFSAALGEADAVLARWRALRARLGGEPA